MINCIKKSRRHGCDFLYLESVVDLNQTTHVHQRGRDHWKLKVMLKVVKLFGSVSAHCFSAVLPDFVRRLFA